MKLISFAYDGPGWWAHTAITFDVRHAPLGTSRAAATAAIVDAVVAAIPMHGDVAVGGSVAQGGVCAREVVDLVAARLHAIGLEPDIYHAFPATTR